MSKDDTKTGIELHRLTIPKAKFDSIPEPERLLFIRFGHAFDEINCLRRLFLWSDPNVPGLEEAETNARMAQAFAIARVLTGKLYETYELIRKYYNSKEISPKYKDYQNDKTREALKNLNRYFDKSNLIDKIRNRYAFHYDFQNEIVEVLRKRPSEDNLVFYLYPDSRNSFFCTADVIVKEAMFEAIEPGDPEKAMMKLEQETIMVTRWLLQVLYWFMSTVVKIYFEKDLMEKYIKVVNIPNPPKDIEIQLPYFLSISEDIENIMS